jgi:sigma-B regulation protein RsbU (phosphoserine phosphatase)
LLSRRLTRPIADLDGSARRLATGDLDARLPEVLSRDEVGRLTQAFHEMRVSLKTYIRDLAETTKAKERLEGELRVARRIQMAMLPGRSAGGPSAGWELAATLEPARQVGGDLYDHFEQDGRVFFLVGDVSGKGVPAALFMARAKTLFQVVAARETDPGEILRRVNLGLVAENDAGMFVTVACGSWDGRSGDLLYSCGGHEPAIRVGSDGKAAAIDAEGGPLLGLLDAASFPVHRVRLEPGEAIVLYTDGVSEANDPEGALFGAERLVAALSGRGGSSAADLTEALLAATREHAAGAPQSDDITILVLRCLPPG